MPISTPFLIGLLTLAAVGYAAATAGMKLASGSVSPSALLLIACGLSLAVLAEIVLLRGAALPVIYLAIVAAETALVLLFALTLGERLSLPQVAGGMLVLAGFAIVALSE